MSAQLQALPGQLGLIATVEGDDPSMPNVPDGRSGGRRDPPGGRWNMLDTWSSKGTGHPKGTSVTAQKARRGDGVAMCRVVPWDLPTVATGLPSSSIKTSQKDPKGRQTEVEDPGI